MEYDDEIENTSDLGGAICILLVVRGFGAKEELWDLLEKSLSDSAFEELKSLVGDYWAERRGD